MGKLIFGINVTLDGCCDHTKGLPDEAVHNYFAQLTREMDVLLYGRKTYELMVPFWPDVAKNPAGHEKAMVDFAQAFTSVPEIVVFSRSLEKVEDKKTKLFRGELEKEIRSLKEDQGKDILIGGVDLSSQLVEMGLVDEIRLVIHPVIAGKGRRLFDQIDLRDQLKFQLGDTKIFQSGAVALQYLKP